MYIVICSWDMASAETPLFLLVVDLDHRRQPGLKNRGTYHCCVSFDLFSMQLQSSCGAYVRDRSVVSFWCVHFMQLPLHFLYTLRTYCPTRLAFFVSYAKLYNINHYSGHDRDFLLVRVIYCFVISFTYITSVHAACTEVQMICRRAAEFAQCRNSS